MSGQALPLPPLRILPPSEIHSNWIHDNGWPSRPGHGARPGDERRGHEGEHGVENAERKPLATHPPPAAREGARLGSQRACLTKKIIRRKTMHAPRSQK